MITVLMLVISTVSYTFSTLNEADQKVKQDITDFSRGSYDILMRPSDARTDLEKQLNLIEENYLGVGDGGITIEQWQEIKNHPDVEIAAPVASVGLFTAKERTWMMNRNEQDRNYYEVEYRTSDGYHIYSNTANSYMYDFGGSIQDILRFPSSSTVDNSYMGQDIASFNVPTSFHQVVAVDPEEERKLTDYDFRPLTERVIDYNAYKDGEFSIPIMSLKDVSLPISIQFTVDELAEVSAEELEIWRSKFIAENEFRTLAEDPDRYFKVIDDYISKKRLNKEKVYKLVPDDGHSPFNEAFLYVNDSMKLSIGDIKQVLGGEVFQLFSQRIGYRLNPVVYEMKEGQKLSIKQIGEDEIYKAPIYREMEKIEFYQLNESFEPENDDDFVGFVDNGTFSIEENAESLASAPLGIYGREMPYLASNPSIKLHPSAVPGSFITTPAHGVISMEYAEKIKGEAPIDAIRVKVAGLTGYDKEAASLIRKLAGEWEDQGFTVDIVAGASLQELPVEVEGIGEVVQSFTTLGAADTIVSSWNALQVVLTILYGLVALTFVSFTFFNLLKDRKRDEQLLARLGWSEKLIRQIRYKEWAWMLVTPILLVSIGFTLYGLLKGQWLPLFLSLCISTLFVCIFLLTDVMQKKQPQQVKKQGETVTAQNIWYYRFSILAACIQLFLTTILTCFLPFFLLENVQITTQTKLGSHVHGEIEGLFIVVIVLLYVLSLTTVYQSLKRMWKKRESEIQLFLYVGWGTKTIRAYFLKEVLVWAGLTAVIGLVVSLIFTALIVEVTPLIIFSGIGGFLLILVVIIGTSIYSLNQVIVKGGSKYAY